MKVISSDIVDSVACTDDCANKDASETCDQHKLIDIQDLLKAHNSSIHNEG